MSGVEISFVLPARNEAQAIPEVVAAALQWLDRGVRGEVVVVDDGSSDGTAEAATRCSDPRVRVIRRHRNQGYGAALRAGACETGGTWILFIDGDGQFDPLEAGALWSRRAEAPLVVGYRLERQDGLVRRALGTTWSAVTRLCFDLPVRDVDCGFKLVEAALFRRCAPQSDGAFVSAELLARARILGVRIIEVGVSHHPRRGGAPTGARPEVISRAVAELVRHGPSLRQGASRHRDLVGKT